MGGSPESDVEVKTVKRILERPKLFHTIVAIVLIALITMAIIYQTFFIPIRVLHAAVPIGTVKGTTMSSYTWTVTAIGGGAYAMQSDVYVTIKNSSGTVVNVEAVLQASGTHGFLYTPASGSTYISVGDVFSLSKDYALGSTISLVTSDGFGQFAVLTA